MEATSEKRSMLRRGGGGESDSTAADSGSRENGGSGEGAGLGRSTHRFSIACLRHCRVPRMPLSRKQDGLSRTKAGGFFI